MESEAADDLIIEKMRSFLRPHLSEEQCEKVIQECRACSSASEPIGAVHVVGAPVVEVNHVSIHLKDEKLGDDDEKPLEIYGHIQVTNGQGKTFFIYNQPEEDPDMLNSGEDLILMDGEPIFSPFPATQMVIYLVDKSRGLELAHGTLILDYTETEISLENRDEKFVCGKDGFATVNYTTFEAAVVPHLDLRLCHRDDCSDNGIGSREIAIHGEILASYESKYSFIEDFCITLFSVERVDSLRVKCGTSIRLCKSILAIPVASSLKLQVSLGGLVNGSTTIDADYIGFCTAQIEGSDGYYVEVNVHWTPGNPKREMVPRQTSLLLNDADPPPLCLYRVPCTVKFIPGTLMEVFAIVILPDGKKNEDDIVNLYGKIEVNSEFVNSEFCVFRREKSCPESFPCGKGKKLMIDGPHKHCFEDGAPAVRVDLKDVRGYVFCKGVIGWNFVTLDGTFRKNCWYNRRLCSIIEGDYGLVKVHYSIFKGARSATVRVSFSFDHNAFALHANVSGNIVAHYGNYDYTTYDRKYYRSVLFSKSQEASLELVNAPKIAFPLLKSAVSVPKDSSLIVEVDLCIISKYDSDGKTLKGVAKFEMDYECCWRLKEKDYFVDVSVIWS